MAKTLILLRHAKSSWDDPALDDFDRPLSRRGAGACAVMAKYIEKRAVAPDCVLASPAARARETVELISAALGSDWLVRYERKLYMAEPRAILAVVRAAPVEAGTVLVVGHNPGLAALARQLAGHKRGRMDPFGKFPTAALATFEASMADWSKLAPAACRLADYATPKGLSGR